MSLVRFKLNHPEKRHFVMRLEDAKRPVIFGNNDVELMYKGDAQCKALDLAEQWKDHYVVCELVWETYTTPPERGSHVFGGQTPEKPKPKTEEVSGLYSSAVVVMQAERDARFGASSFGNYDSPQSIGQTSKASVNQTHHPQAGQPAHSSCGQAPGQPLPVPELDLKCSDQTV